MFKITFFVVNLDVHVRVYVISYSAF